MAFIAEKDVRVEASEPLSVLNNYIKTCAKFLQRSFKMFEGKNKNKSNKLRKKH